MNGELKLTRERRNAEDGLHQAVTTYLSWSLPADACWLPIPNGGWRWENEAKRMKGRGQVRAGVPDLLVISGGIAIFIELKTEVGRLSAVQKQMHAKLVAAGAAVVVCRNQPDVEAVLRQAGVRLRARTT